MQAADGHTRANTLMLGKIPASTDTKWLNTQELSFLVSLVAEAELIKDSISVKYMYNAAYCICVT